MDISSFRTGNERFLEFSGSLKENTSDYETKDLDIQYPVYYEGMLTRFDTDMDLQLDIRYRFKSPCSRCLRDVITEVEHGSDFLILDPSNTEIEEDEVEEEVIFLKGDELPIEDIVMSLVITSIPQKVVCDENCKGLCPKCGKNLNEGSCDCDFEVIDERFAVLKNLFNDNEEV